MRRLPELVWDAAAEREAIEAEVGMAARTPSCAPTVTRQPVVRWAPPPQPAAP